MTTIVDAYSALDDLEWLERTVTGKARRLPSVLTEDGFIRQVLTVARQTQRVVRGSVGEVSARVRRSTAINWPRSTAGQRDRVVEQLSNMIQGLPSEFLPGVRTVLDTSAERVLGDTHRALGRRHKELRVDPTFVARNEPAARAVAETTSLFFAPEYERQAARFTSRARRTIVEGIEQGLGRREIARSLEREFRSSAIHASYWDTVAAVHVNRSRSFSSARSYAEGGVTRYVAQAVGDERTTDICFPAGTPVATAPGRTQSIEDIVPGDSVLGRDGTLHLVEVASVRETVEWVRLTLEDGRQIEATPNHPFWTKANGVEAWVSAGEVTAGDSVWSLWRSCDLVPKQAKEVLLAQLLREGEVGRRGLGRQVLRTLWTILQGSALPRQSRPVSLLFQNVLSADWQEGCSRGPLEEGLRRLFQGVQDQARRSYEEACPLFPGLSASTADSRVRGVWERVRAEGVSAGEVLLTGLLSEVRGGVCTRDPRGDVPRRTRHSVQAGGTGGALLGRLPPGGLLDRSRSRRRVLAFPQERWTQGQGLGQRRAGGRSGRSQTTTVRRGCLARQGAILGDWIRVSKIERFRDRRPCYNLQVAVDPVYFVHGILVHNCRFMDGKVLSVESALDSFDSFEDARDLDEVKDSIMPFMRRQGDQLVLPDGTRVATIGERGGFSNGLSPRALSAAGVNMPPYHHRCRTVPVPVF